MFMEGFTCDRCPETIIDFLAYMNIYKWYSQVTPLVLGIVTTPVVMVSVEKISMTMDEDEIAQVDEDGYLNASCICYVEK
ncbi:hypothetical protein R6Q59_030723 [Mikania micrantha]